MNIEKYCKLAMDEIEKKFAAFACTADYESMISDVATGRPYHISESTEFQDDEQIHIFIHNPAWAHRPLKNPHTHDFFELVYVHKGEFIQIIDGDKIRQTRDQIIILRPDATHAVWIEHDTDIVFNILLRKSIVRQTLLHLISPQNSLYHFFFRAVYDAREQQNYLLFQHTESLTEILDRLIAEYFDRNIEYEQAILAQILILFTEFTRICDSEPSADTDKNTLERILTYIQLNHLTATQQSVAQHFNYSPRQLSRILQNGLNKSYSEIINAYKIENICKCLQHTSIPLRGLVEKMGFSDVNYFYKVFQREKGIPFSRWKSLNNTAEMRNESQL